MKNVSDAEPAKSSSYTISNRNISSDISNITVQIEQGVQLSPEDDGDTIRG